jgi:hypothetical protein
MPCTSLLDKNKSKLLESTVFTFTKKEESTDAASSSTCSSSLSSASACGGAGGVGFGSSIDPRSMVSNVVVPPSAFGAIPSGTKPFDRSFRSNGYLDRLADVASENLTGSPLVVVGKDTKKRNKKKKGGVRPTSASIVPSIQERTTDSNKQKKERSLYTFAVVTSHSRKRFFAYAAELDALFSEMRGYYVRLRCESLQLQAQDLWDGILLPYTHPLFNPVLDCICAISYYWFVLMPLTRGSAICGYESMLSFLMLFDLALKPTFIYPVDICLDWEALLESNIFKFVSEMRLNVLNVNNLEHYSCSTSSGLPPLWKGYDQHEDVFVGCGGDSEDRLSFTSLFGLLENSFLANYAINYLSTKVNKDKQVV